MASTSDEGSLSRIGLITKEMLVCSVCREILVDPVSSCKDWHPVCGVCVPQLPRTQCFCSDELNYVPCISRVLRTIYPQIRCRFNTYGCTTSVSPVDMVAHLKTCNYRPVKCYLASVFGRCTRQLCTPKQIYGHLVDDHGLEPVTFHPLEENGFFHLRHTVDVPYGAFNSAEFWKPLYFSTSDKFLLVPWMIDGILVWWITADTVDIMSTSYKYDTAIQYDGPQNLDEPGDEQQYMVVGRKMPVYGIRYYCYQSLQGVKGSFSSCSLNSLFYKKYGAKDYANEDFITLTISIKLYKL